MAARREGDQDGLGDRLEVGAEMYGALEREDLLLGGFDAEVSERGLVVRLHPLRGDHDADALGPADAQQGQRAVGGEQAIERLARESYDAVFMDVQMPGLDGLATTRILRSKGLRTPVVALTANALSGDREVCIAAGMTDYLPKPLDLGELRAVVQRIAGQ